jgi:hypothetical protein
MRSLVRLAVAVPALLLAGALAAPAHALEFADFTTPGTNAIGGTLLGASVSVAGTAVDAQIVDGSANWFSGPYFTPPLPTSDGFQIHAHSGWSYTIAFGTRVKDPTLQINSLGSRLVFPAGTVLQVVSGNTEMEAKGNILSGTLFTTASGPTEPNGTVRVVGTFESLHFVTERPEGGEDGVLMTVGGSAPDPDPDPDPGSGGGGGGGGSPTSDRDGDHVTDDADCEPDNRAVYPGATDTPGDGIDQDCDHHDAPMREVKRGIAYRYVQAGPAAIRFKTLARIRPRAGDTISVSCEHCAVKDATATVVKSRRRLSLMRFVRGVRFHAGAILRIRLDHPQRISRLYAYHIRKPTQDPVARIRCQAPGAPHPSRCRT